MDLVLDDEKLKRFLQDVLAEFGQVRNFVRTVIPIAQWNGIQVQIVVTRDKDAFCSWPNKHSCLKISD